MQRIKEALEDMAFARIRNETHIHRYSADIRVAALAALIQLKKLEHKQHCQCPDCK